MRDRKIKNVMKGPPSSKRIFSGSSEAVAEFFPTLAAKAEQDSVANGQADFAEQFLVSLRTQLQPQGKSKR